MRIAFCVSLSLLLMLAFYGCGEGSAEVEMKDAQKAMDQAKSVHADDFAPAEFQAAQKTWDHAQAADREGKASTAKALYSSAKIYFNKTVVIARSKHDDLSRQLSAMQLMINSNFDQVKSDLSKKSLSPKQHSQVSAIVSEVSEDKDSISKLVVEEDLIKAVAAAKDVQTKIYNAQLILAGQKPHKQEKTDD